MARRKAVSTWQLFHNLGFGYRVICFLTCVLIGLDLYMVSSVESVREQKLRVNLEQETIPTLTIESMAAEQKKLPLQPSFGIPKHDAFGDTSSKIEGKSVQAFYYAWWASASEDGEWSHWDHVYLPHWTDSVNRRYPNIGTKHLPPDDIGARFYPSLGPYSSASKEIIRRHLTLMKEAGVDTLVYSWYPRGLSDENGISGNPDKLMPLVLEEAERVGLWVAIHLEPYPSRNAATVMIDIEYINQKYGMHPALFKRKRKGSKTNKPVPVVYIYDSYQTSTSSWRLRLQDRDNNSDKDAFL